MLRNFYAPIASGFDAFVVLALALLLPFAWLLLLGAVALSRRDRASLPDLLAGTRMVLG